MLEKLFRGAWFWARKKGEQEMPGRGGSSELAGHRAPPTPRGGAVAVRPAVRPSARLVITVKAADKQENDGMIPLPPSLPRLAVGYTEGERGRLEGMNRNNGREGERPVQQRATCWEGSTNKPSGMPDNADK